MLSRRRLLFAGVIAVVGALMVSLLPGPATAVGRKGRGLAPQTTDQYEQLPKETFIVPSDGGDVYVEYIRPAVPEGTRVPVILTFTPYDLFLSDVDDGITSFFVPKGYARALAHVPGTGNSGGCWDYGGAKERQAGYDLVEWLGTQDWSNGRVGMIGGSYDGTTANMAAVDNPPHLATIVPEVAISQWYGYAYHDGVRYFVMDPIQNQGLIIDEQGFDTPVGFDFGFGFAPPIEPQEAPPTATVERLCPDVKAEHTQAGYDPEPDYNEFWQERSYIREAEDVDVPVLVTSGWKDYNVKFSESTRWFEALPDNIHKMLLMDQVSHGTPASAAFQFQTLLHAWFDQYLYRYRTNVNFQPSVQSVGNDGVLRTSESWPPEGQGRMNLYLTPDGTLSQHRPSRDEIEVGSYTDSGTSTESHAINTKGADGDLLWFESEPLTRDLRVAGTPLLSLQAESSAASTHYTPVLYDLGPPVNAQAQCEYAPAQEGCTMGRGFLNARYVDGLETGVDLTPGERYGAQVRFLGNDWVVPAGHRIGLALMSSNANWALPDQNQATNTFFTSARKPSFLRLSVSTALPGGARKSGPPAA